MVAHRTLWVALGLQIAEAQHTAAEAACLARWVRGRQHVVEVGVAEGASAALLRRDMAPDGRLWLVDPFHLSRNPVFNSGLVAARRTVRRVDGPPFEIVQAKSADALSTWDMPLDFVFVDADHSYEGVLADWQGWSPHIRAGGVVAFHDAVAAPGHPDGPPRAIDRLFRVDHTEKDWAILDECETVVVVGRRNEQGAAAT